MRRTKARKVEGWKGGKHTARGRRADLRPEGLFSLHPSTISPFHHSWYGLCPLFEQALTPRLIPCSHFFDDCFPSASSAASSSPPRNAGSAARRPVPRKPSSAPTWT